MALSVIPFRRQCTANISSSIPTERSCTKRCDSTLQRVLSQPSCLARWSSAEAKRSESKVPHAQHLRRTAHSLA